MNIFGQNNVLDYTNPTQYAKRVGDFPLSFQNLQHYNPYYGKQIIDLDGTAKQQSATQKISNFIKQIRNRRNSIVTPNKGLPDTFASYQPSIINNAFTDLNGHIIMGQNSTTPAILAHQMGHTTQDLNKFVQRKLRSGRRQLAAGVAPSFIRLLRKWTDKDFKADQVDKWDVINTGAASIFNGIDNYKLSNDIIKHQLGASGKAMRYLKGLYDKTGSKLTPQLLPDNQIKQAGSLLRKALNTYKKARIKGTAITAGIPLGLLGIDVLIAKALKKKKQKQKQISPIESIKNSIKNKKHK